MKTGIEDKQILYEIMKSIMDRNYNGDNVDIQEINNMLSQESIPNNMFNNFNQFMKVYYKILIETENHNEHINENENEREKGINYFQFFQ